MAHLNILNSVSGYSFAFRPLRSLLKSMRKRHRRQVLDAFGERALVVSRAAYTWS